MLRKKAKFKGGVKNIQTFIRKPKCLISTNSLKLSNPYGVFKMLNNITMFCMLKDDERYALYVQTLQWQSLRRTSKAEENKIDDTTKN